MGRKWLHLKKFDPQLAFKCLKAYGAIRALHFSCNEDKQVPAVKFIPGSGLKGFYSLQLFRSFGSDFISVFRFSHSGQAEMYKPWFCVCKKSRRDGGERSIPLRIKTSLCMSWGLTPNVKSEFFHHQIEEWSKMTWWPKVTQRVGA